MARTRSTKWRTDGLLPDLPVQSVEVVLHGCDPSALVARQLFFLFLAVALFFFGVRLGVGRYLYSEKQPKHL